MLTVAFATENNDFDAEVYRVLLQKILDEEVVRWRSTHRFSGWKSVLRLAQAHLDDAAAHGIRHALLAIDNDGGLKRRPEHEDSHNAAEQAADQDEGCAHCLLSEAVPRSWGDDGGMHCLVVPVQVLETWLLILRGDEFNGLPERFYDRRALKVRFFGRPQPSEQTRINMALEQIQKPDVLATLRERPSFRRFEAQLGAWRTKVSSAQLV